MIKIGVRIEEDIYKFLQEFIKANNTSMSITTNESLKFLRTISELLKIHDLRFDNVETIFRLGIENFKKERVKLNEKTY
jgi:hypothetical protein